MCCYLFSNLIQTNVGWFADVMWLIRRMCVDCTSVCFIYAFFVVMVLDPHSWGPLARASWLIKSDTLQGATRKTLHKITYTSRNTYEKNNWLCMLSDQLRVRLDIICCCKAHNGIRKVNLLPNTATISNVHGNCLVISLSSTIVGFPSHR